MKNMLIWQYRGKPKAKATIDALSNETADVFKSAVALGDLLNIETATGWALDLVGMHVGVSRRLPSIVKRVYFGWHGDDSSAGWSVGEWYSYGRALRDPLIMDDDNFRFLIKAKILKNYQKADLDSLIESVRFLFGENANIVDACNMTMTVILPFRQLNALQIYAITNLDILRRPATVKYNFFQVDANNPFGWAHDPNASGFGKGVCSRFL